ncbi:unnamed protein product, partial [Mesorhabditis spiculigera]
RLLAITCVFLAVFAKPHITEAEKNAFVSHVKTNTSGLYFVDLKTDASDEAEDQDTKAKRAVADPEPPRAAPESAEDVDSSEEN